MKKNEQSFRNLWGWNKTHQNNSLCSQICFPQISKWKWDWMLDKLIWIYKILLPKRHSFIDEGLTAAYLHYHMHCCVFKGFSPEWIADIPGPWKFPRKKSSVSCFFVFFFSLKWTMLHFIQWIQCISHE